MRMQQHIAALLPDVITLQECAHLQMVFELSVAITCPLTLPVCLLFKISQHLTQLGYTCQAPDSNYTPAMQLNLTAEVRQTLPATSVVFAIFNHHMTTVIPQ